MKKSLEKAKSSKQVKPEAFKKKQIHPWFHKPMPFWHDWHKGVVFMKALVFLIVLGFIITAFSQYAEEDIIKESAFTSRSVCLQTAYSNYRENMAECKKIPTSPQKETCEYEAGQIYKDAKEICNSPCLMQGNQCVFAKIGCGRFKQLGLEGCPSDSVCCENAPFCGDGFCDDYFNEDIRETPENCPEDCEPEQELQEIPTNTPVWLKQGIQSTAQINDVKNLIEVVGISEESCGISINGEVIWVNLGAKGKFGGVNLELKDAKVDMCKVMVS